MSDASRALTLRAVGDVCLAGVDSDPFVHLDGELTADVTFCNLECALTLDRTPTPNKVVFAAGPEAAAWVRRFDVVCLANNHVLDFGQAGLADTLEALDRVGGRYVGAGHSVQAAGAPLIVKKKGFRVAVVATADVGGAASGGPAVAAKSLADLVGDVRSARAEADVVVASFHGGVELDTVPTPFVVRSLRALVDAGADVVLGHHPHVLQGVELYSGGVIAYSLGNFSFDNRRYGASAALASKTMILEVTIDPPTSSERAPDKGTRARSVSFRWIPARIGADGFPRPMEGAEAQTFDDEMRVLGRACRTVDASATDERRVEGFASSIHRKSPGTIARYAWRHRRDFTPGEIALGLRLIVQNTWRRVRKTR